MGWEREQETVTRDTRTQRGAAWSSDVAVPFGQAALVALAVVIGSLVVTMGLTVWRRWPWWLPFVVALAMGGLAFAGSGVLLVMDTRRLLWALEVVADVDIDQDGAKGPPTDVLRVEVLERDNGRTTLRYADLPADREQLRALARGLLNGKGTSEGEWIGAGNPFSRSQYNAVRSEMIRRGLAAWRDPDHHAQGWELTAVGRHVMRRLLEEPTALPRRP